MNLRRWAPVVAALLIIVALAAILARSQWRAHREIPRGDTIWRLTYTVDYRADQAGARVRLGLPLDTPYSRVFRQDVVPTGGTIERSAGRADHRDVAVTTTETGPAKIVAQFDVHLSARGVWESPSDQRLTAAARREYLKSETSVQVDDPAVTAAVQRIAAESRPEPLVDRLFEFCQTEIGPGGKAAPRDAAAAIDQGLASPLGRARALVALCRAAKVPARLVTGFEVKLGVDVQPRRWVEVYIGDSWRSLDPEMGFAAGVPRDYVPVEIGGAELIRGKHISQVHATYAIARLPPETGMGANDNRQWWDMLDLTRTPVEGHETLIVILLMPLGGLATSFIRTVIGVRTFGTFTPTLLAMAFVYNDWRMGLIVFFAVLVVGLVSRSWLDRLKLLVVPRLSILLTLVVLCVVFGVSIFEYFNPTRSAQTVLLPMVILTMMIERFFLTSEEDGPRFAVQLLTSTLLVAFLCYLLLRWKAVGQLLLVYPENHLITVAALVMLGRYSGYRWTELWRFRDLADDGSH